MKDITEHLKETKARVINKGNIKFDTLNEEECLAAVEEDGMLIEMIEFPSRAVKLAAVKNNGYAIRHIKNPSEEIEVAAVKQNHYAVVIMRTPCEKAQLAVIEYLADALQYIRKPTEKVIIEADRRDKETIQNEDINK